MSNVKKYRNCISVSVSIPIDLLFEIDEKVEELKLKSRSEYIVRFLENKQYKNTL